MAVQRSRWRRSEARVYHSRGSPGSRRRADLENPTDSTFVPAGPHDPPDQLRYRAPHWTTARRLVGSGHQCSEVAEVEIERQDDSFFSDSFGQNLLIRRAVEA